MLITYVPAHVLGGSTLGWFPYSTLAFGISYLVCQAKRRRQLVLQSWKLEVLGLDLIRRATESSGEFMQSREQPIHFFGGVVMH
jgi:hypothetical protein